MIYANLRIESRKALANLVGNPQTTDTDLFAVGGLLILIAMARKGDTILESRDMLRNAMGKLETDLVGGWDQLRQLK